MRNEKFTPGEWFLGNPFRHKDSISEWCNVYADGENNHITEVLVYDGINDKTYYNAALIAAAPEMYRLLKHCMVHWQKFQFCKQRLIMF